MSEDHTINLYLLAAACRPWRRSAPVPLDLLLGALDLSSAGSTRESVQEPASTSVLTAGAA